MKTSSRTVFVAVLAAAGAFAEPPGGQLEQAHPHWGFAGTPLFNYSSDTGVGFGARGVAQRRAEGAARYSLSLEAQAYGSSGGTQLHFLSVDVPSLADSAWRLDALAGYYRNAAAHYYGLGNHPRLSEDEVDSHLESAPVARVRARRTFLGHASLQLGYRMFFQNITAPQRSLLAREAPFGSAGGLFSELAVGLAWDTRDDELAPTRGVLLETAARTTLRALGSSGNAAGFYASAAAYQPIRSGWLIAARIAVDAWVGEVPFDRLGDFGTLLSPFLVVSGMGGGLTVRGLVQSEYVGKLKGVSNLELRFPLGGFDFFSRRVTLSGVAFADAGQIDGGPVRLGVGGGLRIRWGQFFLVRMDAGYAEDRARFYLDFGNVF